jgi:hypothetical protein
MSNIEKILFDINAARELLKTYTPSGSGFAGKRTDAAILDLLERVNIELRESKR